MPCDLGHWVKMLGAVRSLCDHVFMNDSMDYHGTQRPGVPNVVEGIAFEEQEVGPIANFESAELVFLFEKSGAARGGSGEGLGGRQTRGHHQRQLLVG